MLRLLGAQLAIGAAAIFARYALEGAGPIAVSAARLAIAALVALAVARGIARLSIRRELAFGCAGLALAVHFGVWIASLLYTSVALSTLLVTTTPLWTEAYDALRKRRPPAGSFLAALTFAFAGVALIAFARTPVPAPVPGKALLGDALALGGGLAIGIYLALVRAAGESHDGSRLATRQIVARTYGWAALALLVASFASRQAPPPLYDGGAWAGIVAMALVSQSLGHTALNAALRDYTPSIVALSTLLEPVAAALLAAALFHETLSWQAALGGALVLAAVATTLRSAKRTDASGTRWTYR
jgi:drug/metabolite transporter (DMT)-like permease